MNTSLINIVIEFLHITGSDNIVQQIKNLHKLYSSKPDNTLNSDPEAVAILARNVKAVVKLIKDLHNYYDYDKSGWDRLPCCPAEQIKFKTYLRTFIETSDKDAGNWITFLFTEYLDTDQCDRDSRETRYRLGTNSVAASELCQRLYDYHKAGEF